MNIGHIEEIGTIEPIEEPRVVPVREGRPDAAPEPQVPQREPELVPAA